MNKKLSLAQTIITSLICVIMILGVYYVSGLSILSVVVSALFVIIATLSDNKGTFTSVTIVTLALLFFLKPVYIFDICLNCIIPGIIIGIITKKVLNHNYENKFEPIFAGTLAFILGLIANYLVSRYLFDINMLEEFTSTMKEQLSAQMDIMQEYMEALSSVAPNITTESMLQTILNIMPLIMFSRAIILSIATYFIAIFALKRIKTINMKQIKFSKFYLPGNAVVISFIMYIIIMLLEMIKIPLYTDLILVNLESIFYILFLIQGIAVSVFFAKKWFKTRQFFKFFAGLISIFSFGIVVVSMIGMVDCVFDFRKVKSCELM